MVEHFHTRTRTGKIGNLNKFSPTPYMEMNPDAASEARHRARQLRAAVSRRGDAVVMVQLTQRVPPDMVFIPFHFHECVNRLTLGLLDPHSRQPAFKQCAVRIERAADQQRRARHERRRARLLRAGIMLQATPERAELRLPARRRAPAAQPLWQGHRDWCREDHPLRGQEPPHQRRPGRRRESQPLQAARLLFQRRQLHHLPRLRGGLLARRTICPPHIAFRSVGYVEGGS